MKTTAGPVMLARPKLRGTTEAFASRLLQDLRRGLLEPPRQLRPRTVTATRDGERTGNVSATA